MRQLRLPYPRIRSLRFPSLTAARTLSAISFAGAAESAGSSRLDVVAPYRPVPAIVCGHGTALPAFQNTPSDLCPALRSRSGPHARGLHTLTVMTYCVHGGAAPTNTNRKAPTIQISRFNDAASTHAPYASCAPCGNTTQCSLPSGCQPFSGGRGYPLGNLNMFHFVYLIINSSCFGSWRDAILAFY